MILKDKQKILRSLTTNILIMSLIIVMMVIGSCATVNRVTLQDHTISISTGQKLMWDHQILDKQIGFFSTFGRRANWIGDVTECAILRIDGLGLVSWHQLSVSTRLRLQRTLGLGSYLRLEQMLRRCSQIRLYRSQLIIPSSLNQYRTVWKGRKLNYPTKSRQEDLQEKPFGPPPSRRPRRYKKDWIQPSIGRTPETTRTMGRSYNSSFMTNPGNGNVPTISSITGGSQKRASGSDPK